MADPYAYYPHRASKERFLIFVPLDSGANDPDVPIIFDTQTDVNLNCGHCGHTLISYRVGERMKVKRGVLDEKERRIRCPHCMSAAQEKAEAEKAAAKTKPPAKRTASRKSPRTRRAKSTPSQKSKDSAPKK